MKNFWAVVVIMSRYQIYRKPTQMLDHLIKIFHLCICLFVFMPGATQLPSGCQEPRAKDLCHIVQVGKMPTF